ncbi:MAG TPA: hypothetical protein VGH73_19395 [Thermoanaerobaculia bacterium]|jgi:hypothetical protein
MLSYICEFNLNVSGEKADSYLHRIVREWPALWEKLPGVHGTLLLQNAFALGGKFAYAFRVDIESFKTLQVIDDALKSDDRQWRKIRSEYFEHRTEVRARLLQQGGGGESYLRPAGGGDGLIHLVVSHDGGGDAGGAKAPAFARSQGVQAVQQHSAFLQASAVAGRNETWLRLANLASLDEVHNSFAQLGASSGTRVTSHLFGELREVNGVLHAGA